MASNSHAEISFRDALPVRVEGQKWPYEDHKGKNDPKYVEPLSNFDAGVYRATDTKEDGLWVRLVPEAQSDNWPGVWVYAPAFAWHDDKSKVRP